MVGIHAADSQALQVSNILAGVHSPGSTSQQEPCDTNVSLKPIHKYQNCLQWGRSNLVDPAESPKIRLLNRDFGNILSVFPRKNSKTQSSLNFL